MIRASLRWPDLRVSVFVVFVAGIGGRGLSAADVDLNQKWDQGDRNRFYYTSQGSRLLPYRWFLALERPGSNARLSGPENMRRLRFVAEDQPDPTLNPDRLPIGFVKDTGTASPPPNPEVVKTLIDPLYDPARYPRTNEWLGFTCAACHTGRLDVPGASFRIDGGSSMSDMRGFLEELNGSFQATLRDPAKKARFLRLAVKDSEVCVGVDRKTAEETLWNEFETFARLYNSLALRDAVPDSRRYSFGRLDAFGAIFNQVGEYAVGIADNHRIADAPISYPPLWDTPRFDWLQTNAISGLAIFRNVGQVVGVFADFNIKPTPPGGFASSARVDTIDKLEKWVATLEAPAWPEAIGGRFAIDPDRKRVGESLYQANCASCHPLRGADGKYPRNTAMESGPDVVVIKTRTLALDEIRTDPRFIANFLQPVKTGSLAPFLDPPDRNSPTVARGVLLAAVVKNVVVRKLIQDGIVPGTPQFKAKLDEMNGFHKVDSPAPLNGGGYRTRPLNGIWATPPYLHNGSVPTLYQLLLPEEDRVKSFALGSWAFDPHDVGLAANPSDATDTFQVVDASGRPIPGNSNAGHSGANYTMTSDGKGGMRLFTEDERRALLEFLKTLK